MAAIASDGLRLLQQHHFPSRGPEYDLYFGPAGRRTPLSQQDFAREDRVMKRISMLALLVIILMAPGLTMAQIRIPRIRHRHAQGNRFRRLDLNGDGRISRSEWRGRQR